MGEIFYFFPLRKRDPNGSGNGDSSVLSTFVIVLTIYIVSLCFVERGGVGGDPYDLLTESPLNALMIGGADQLVLVESRPPK